jgi:hypothetical protein
MNNSIEQQNTSSPFKHEKSTVTNTVIGKSNIQDTTNFSQMNKTFMTNESNGMTSINDPYKSLS